MVVEYYESGDTLSAGIESYGVKEGVWKKYAKGNKLIAKNTYDNGVQEGLQESFYSNGQRKDIYTTRNELQFPWRYWFLERLFRSR
jgi:antitoxin component YwqK of YwqJK toxin-antitoxin module